MRTPQVDGHQAGGHLYPLEKMLVSGVSEIWTQYLL